MKKFKLYCSEIVRYEIVVEGKTKDEAYCKVLDLNDSHIVDHEGFQTDDIEEVV